MLPEDYTEEGGRWYETCEFVSPSAGFDAEDFAGGESCHKHMQCDGAKCHPEYTQSEDYSSGELADSGFGDQHPGLCGQDDLVRVEVQVVDGVEASLKVMEGIIGYGVRTSKRCAYANPARKELINLPPIFEKPYVDD